MVRFYQLLRRVADVREADFCRPGDSDRDTSRSGKLLRKIARKAITIHSHYNGQGVQIYTDKENYSRGDVRMKKIPVTGGLLALVDDEDYPTLSLLKWHKQPGANTWYAATNVLQGDGKYS